MSTDPSWKLIFYLFLLSFIFYSIKGDLIIWDQSRNKVRLRYHEFFYGGLSIIGFEKNSDIIRKVCLIRFEGKQSFPISLSPMFSKSMLFFVIDWCLVTLFMYLTRLFILSIQQSLAFYLFLRFRFGFLRSPAINVGPITFSILTFIIQR